MKQFFSIITLITIISSLIPTNTFASNTKETYFIVTAYYSPLPNQKHYLKGDYESEKRLNGQGIRGASGKKVFSGMLAGPKGYAFGTKIYLEGLGVGEISDRGGAIVHAGNRGYSYDRIDLWVGHGDEGLKRALYWGKRKIKGKIISRATPTTINNKKVPAPNWATKGLRKISSIFNISLGVGSDKNKVIELQKFLNKIGKYNGKIDGIYSSKIINIIHEFQLENKLIKKTNLYGAGYWGTKTRNLMLKKYLNGEFDSKVEKKSEKKVDNRTLFDKPLKTIKETKELQEVLKKLDLYKGDINGSYLDIKNIILNFQIKNKIIKKETDIGSSYFGPKTRAVLKIKYEEYKKIENEKLEIIKRKKDLENKFKTLENLSLKEAKKEIDQIGTPIFGETSSEVRKLQQKLKKLGYFNHKDTAIFGSITKKSLIKYQIEKKLITSEKQYGAGIFGPKTKESFKNDLAKLILEKKIRKNKNLAMFLNKTKKENIEIINDKEIAEKTENKNEISFKIKKSNNSLNKKELLEVMYQIENRIIT